MYMSDIMFKVVGDHLYILHVEREFVWPYSSEPESSPLPIHLSGIKIETDYCNVMQFVS